MHCFRLILATLILTTLSVSQGHEGLPPSKQQDLGDWQKDPVCQAVFFGVLDGLYRDNVSLKAVDNIIGSHDCQKTLEERLQRSFVTKCSLCEPTFHAFLAYQSHKVQCATLNFGDKSKPLDEEITSNLESNNLLNRHMAMAGLINKWVGRKFKNSDLTETQIADWRHRVGARSEDGKSKLMRLMKEGEHYKGWSIYYGCAACKGVLEASPMIRRAD